jgi:hypothetical protein
MAPTMTKSVQWRPVRLVAYGLCTSIALVLTACGGGGSGGADANSLPPPTNTPPVIAPPVVTPVPDLLAAGTVTQDYYRGRTLLVFDPSAPNPPRLAVALSPNDSYQKQQARNFDAASNTLTYLGEQVVYYTTDYKLFKISLRKTDTTEPTQVSSLDNICRIRNIWESALGQDAVIEVEVAPAVSSCNGYVPGRALIPASTPATTLTASLPSSYAVLQQLPDLSSPQAQLFVVRDTNTKLWLHDVTQGRFIEIIGGDGAYSYFSGTTPLRTPSSAYVFVNGELRELSWSSTAATLRPSIYRVVGPGSLALVPVGAQSHVLVDGLTIKRVMNGTVSAPMATLDGAKGNVVQAKAVTPTHVILEQSSSTNSLLAPSLYSVDKQDLRLQALGTTAGSGAATLGYREKTVFYKANGLIRRVNVDGSDDRLVAGSLAVHTRSFYSRTVSAYNTPVLEGVLWCERAVGDTTCANGRLKLLNTTTLGTTVLGQFSHTISYSTWDPLEGYDGTSSTFSSMESPLMLVSNGTPTQTGLSEMELFVAQPGTANSLVQVRPAP